MLSTISLSRSVAKNKYYIAIGLVSTPGGRFMVGLKLGQFKGPKSSPVLAWGGNQAVRCH